MTTLIIIIGAVCSIAVALACSGSADDEDDKGNADLDATTSTNLADTTIQMAAADAAMVSMPIISPPSS